MLTLTHIEYRAVVSLTILDGQDLHFPHSFFKFRSSFLVFPQFFFIFFLILVLRSRTPGKALATPLIEYLEHKVLSACCQHLIKGLADILIICQLYFFVMGEKKCT